MLYPDQTDSGERLKMTTGTANLLGRRALIGGSIATGIAATLPARAAEALRFRPIWPGGPPGSAAVHVVEREVPRSATGPADDTAFVHVRTPALVHGIPTRPNGAAMLLIPGGGYRRVAIGHDGRDMLRFFAERGYHVYLLKYRLPGDGWAAGPDTPLQDAQRALRVVRAEAAANGVAKDRIGVMGLSAGGHLAAMLAYRSDATYPATDAIDAQLLGVRIAGLLYPVALMGVAGTHRASQEQLLGPAATPEQAARYRSDARITGASPPTFLTHALDDAIVGVDNSLALLGALRRAKVAAEAYLPELGGHGFGVLRDGRAAPWTALFLDWARRHGL